LHLSSTSKEHFLKSDFTRLFANDTMLAKRVGKLSREKTSIFWFSLNKATSVKRMFRCKRRKIEIYIYKWAFRYLSVCWYVEG